MLEEFKDLIIGKITGEWGKEAPFGEGVKVIRTANFTNIGLINFEKIVFRDITQNKIEQKKLIKGDIIIEKSGGSPNQPVGRVVYFDLETDEEYLCNNFTAILRPDSNKVFPKYLFYQMFIAHKRGRTLKYQNKTTGIINLKLDSYLTEEIIVPPLPDQIRIATILSKAEALIKQRKQSIDLLDELLKSIFSDMFGDPYVNPNKFKKDLLKNYFITTPQNGLYKHSSFYGEGTPILRIDSFYNGKVEELGLLKRVKLSNEELSKYSLAPNDIVINRVNSREYLGKVGLIPELYEKTVFESNMMRFSIDETILNPNFLVALLCTNYIKRQILSCAKDAVNQSSINQQDVKSLEIYVPPIDLQTHYALIEKKIESIKAQYKVSINEFENLFGSLSQRAFKGKLDLSKMPSNNKKEAELGLKAPLIKKIADEFDKTISTRNEILKPVIEKVEEIERIKKQIPTVKLPPVIKEAQKAVEQLKPIIKQVEQIKEIEKQIPLVEVPPIVIESHKSLEKIKWAVSERPKIPKIEQPKTWKNLSVQQIANKIKDNYKGYHFNFEMVVRYIQNSFSIEVDYYSSEELKQKPPLNEAVDLKSLIFSALNNENTFLELEQLFYNGEKENFPLKITSEDYKLIKDRSAEERSGIYFNITK